MKQEKTQNWTKRSRRWRFFFFFFFFFFLIMAE
ncbi:uncharacterized protein ARB_05840 [Trichophyton benhamiae CBS 112371]|uniref:Uncharacterized protein n=1 Tax=Arthroderma benhamiae (strain ATCC MYA-4681 / CBS 112371) TaxID=663331 RepID=D4ANM3_ARTBC|nr:uncharacterized protein ARB_05840 [Trichophyton benhamiae CBS 112371]EFE34884.1 hypothetical protein ARB_05840 [Trichophyton benhamiae CBS 112371]